LIEENKITVGRASVDETVSENEKKPEFEEIKELGKTSISSSKGNIHCLTVIGQIEGHMVLPPQTKQRNMSM